MTKELILELLDMFHIEYKKYGEEMKDAVDIVIDNEVEITFSQFDDKFEICLTDDGDWWTYEDVKQSVLRYVSLRDNK